MKFVIEREQLLKPLQQVSNSLNGRPILPILSNILLRVTENTLCLIGTDLEIEITAYVELSLPYEAGAITIPARKFFNICRSLPERAKILVQLEGNRILVRSGRSSFLLSTLPATDFPNVEDWISELEFSLPQIKIRYLIEMTYFSMAYQDVRYYLNGLLLEIVEKELHAVATDGHRLAICSIPIDISLPKYSVIVPRKGIIELMRILNNIDTPVLTQIGNNKIRVNIGDCIFTSKLINGDYPDYRCILPKNQDKILEVNSNVLRKAFSRVSILSNSKFHSVCLCIRKNQLKVISNNHEQEEAEEIIDVIYTGDEIEINFNIKYIMDILNALKCKNIRILLTDSISCMQIEDITSKDATYIIMPMRL